MAVVGMQICRLLAYAVISLNITPNIMKSNTIYTKTAHGIGFALQILLKLPYCLLSRVELLLYLLRN
jgi:hypothetical protein